MKFSDYMQTEAFRKAAARRSISKKKNVFEFVFALVFLALGIVLALVTRFVSDDVKHEGWFIALIVTLTLVCFAAAAIIEFVFFLRGRMSRCHYLDPALGGGILLLVRELPFDLRSFIKNGELFLPVRFQVQGDYFLSVAFGEKEPVLLDLSPWNGVEHDSSWGVASLPVLDFLSHTDIYSLSLRTVCLVPTATDGMKTEEGDPIFLVKKGKWTLFGRMLKGDYKRIAKATQKLVSEVVL